MAFQIKGTSVEDCSVCNLLQSKWKLLVFEHFYTYSNARIHGHRQQTNEMDCDVVSFLVFVFRFLLLLLCEISVKLLITENGMPSRTKERKREREGGSINRQSARLCLMWLVNACLCICIQANTACECVRMISCPMHNFFADLDSNLNLFFFIKILVLWIIVALRFNRYSAIAYAKTYWNSLRIIFENKRKNVVFSSISWIRCSWIVSEYFCFKFFP